MRIQSVNLAAAALAAGLVLAQAPKSNKPAGPAAGSAAPAAAAAATQASAPTSFDSTVPPVFRKSCAPCHNDRLASGGLNLDAFNAPTSVLEHRDEWERILQKIRTGEMPPKGMPRPPAEQLEAMAKVVHDTWE